MMHIHMPMTADECAWCFVLAMALGTLSMVILYAVFSLLNPKPSASQIAPGVGRLGGELEAQRVQSSSRRRDGAAGLTSA